MKRRRHHGYVLLMTLAMLVMASTLLVAIGRGAVSQALAASAAQEQLQRKWGTISCRNAILPNAESVLATLEATDNRPVARVRASIRLNTQQFDLIIGDEQAKANVNAMLDSQTVAQVENRLRESLSGSGLLNSIRVRPVLDDDVATITQPNPSAPALVDAIRTFGQITSDVSPDRLCGVDGPSPIAAITLWGNGAINILRADEPAMKLALWPTLSGVQISRLVAARNQLAAISRTSHADSLGKPSPQPTVGGSGSPMAYLIAQAQIDPKTASKLTVTVHSTVHSLWILCKDRQRVWYDFNVVDDSSPQHVRRDHFQW